MIFTEEPIVRQMTANGLATVKISKNALKLYVGDQLLGRLAIPRLSADNLRDYIFYNRNRGMIDMFVNEAQTSLIAQLVNDLYAVNGFVVPQAQAQGGNYTPQWLYAKYVYHWLSKYYEDDYEPQAVPCYIPDEEDDFSNEPEPPPVNYARKNIQDRADAPDGQFYFLTWEGDKKCRLVVTRDLLCIQKPIVVGEIPILDIDEEYIIRFLKSERRKAIRTLMTEDSQDALENLYYLHNLLLPFIFYTQETDENLLLYALG